MIVLGVDPGTRHLGWGVVDRSGTRVRHVAHGVIDTDPKAPLGERLVQIERELSEVVAAHAPTHGAIEALFFGKDASAAAKLGHARGVAMLVLARAGLSLGEYPPASVKRALVGGGAATKHQVNMVVSRVLGLPKIARADAADALAVAIHHAHVAAVQARYVALAAARPARRPPLALPRPRGPVGG